MIDQQHGKCRFVHLDAGPERSAIEPHVLGPMPVGLLRHDEEAQHGLQFGVRPRREEATGGFHHVTRPHQMIAAKITVALGGAPRHRQTGDGTAVDVHRHVGLHDGHAGAKQMRLGRTGVLVQREQWRLPCGPRGHIPSLGDGEWIEERRASMHGGSFGIGAKPDRDGELSRHIPRIDFNGHRDVAVFSAVVTTRDVTMFTHVVPRILGTNECCGALGESDRRDHGQHQCVSLRKQHGMTPVLTHPSTIPATMIAQMRTHQQRERVVVQRANTRGETHMLEHHVEVRRCTDALLNDVPSLVATVDEAKCRYARRQPFHGMVAMSFLFGEEAVGRGHQQTGITQARRVDFGIVDLVQYAVADGEPHARSVANCGTHGVLGAGRPFGIDARPAGCFAV